MPRELKIGCVGVVVKMNGRDPYQVLALRCAKGRGLILPGGKFEQGIDRTYRHGAARETEEETRVRVNIEDYSLIHHGLSATYKHYLYCYLFTDFDDSNMGPTAEGDPSWVYPHDLLNQRDCLYVPIYDVIFGMKAEGLY